MAFDTYLKISGPDVEGESLAKGMENWIEVFSFSWGASNPTTVGTTSGGLSAGKASVSSFNIMKKQEKSSTNLFSRCCTGQHYDKAVVEMRKATGLDGGQKTFMKYTFENVFVESIQWSGSTGGDDTPTESVSFAFAKVTMEYSKQDMKGDTKPAGTASYDVTKVTK